jgi:hypothetical protein
VRLNPFVLAARSRHIKSWLCIVAGVFILGSLVPHETVSVPVRSFAAVTLPPLIAALPGVFVGNQLTIAHVEMEEVTSRSTLILRCMWMGALYCSSWLCVWLALRGGLAASVVTRNCALTVGLTSLLVVLAPADISWVPALTLVAINGLYGTTDGLATPQWWALLLQPQGSKVALIVSVVIAGAGSLSWIIRGQRRISRGG